MSDFWSKRRASVVEETEADERAVDAAVEAESEATIAEKSDEELLHDLGLPDPDTLTDENRIKEFLNDAVPNRLKTRALRRLWHLNPVLANVDGLVDYGEDFTDAAMIVENMQTTYQVGKGMLKHVLDMERQKEAQDAPVEIEVAALDTAADAQDDEEPEFSPDPPIADFSPQTGEPVQELADSTTDAPVVPARRMQFSFEDHRTG